ncbi:hypothetical protein PHYBLDRAFT_148820 [Phycomyces blakesleeanus NRRL 1555(-)]|uniref:Uncharacterized protein n=1 Tax=Phycomyces blakesleeanus (strain ATCC 8743b / DSM 1359 / FGSC 10004 / NBRC 33097 / NRRL 1555) TaxID=763407 RepID=A0A162NJL6_PHYB8|nr:hypothetical protein PHYBLDRAFT_148820 [Phycomyces blakesleeanus NRRL 1555(-)]OAD70274.1 hypothetical protein PHYBLDRAFT_148820 [Phycomyces blakesleeanus NRRL 1555(-)]|eukprot:XP_018288314.1 hypothetical protein PHYBLDRAFT_148820 [Phycomyces blakesleeanus NRRL 1555(-)]
MQGVVLRQKNGTAFQDKYKAYWADRADADDTVTEVVKKHIFKMVAVTKIVEVNKSVHEINREISDEELLDIDNGGVLDISKGVIEEEKLAHLRGIGVIHPYQLETSCEPLVNAIEKIPPTTHADFNFVEVFGTHFPVNPHTSKKLERDVARHTSIIVLNNLFLADNDIIDLCWLERSTDHTDSKIFFEPLSLLDHHPYSKRTHCICYLLHHAKGATEVYLLDKHHVRLEVSRREFCI